MFYGILSPSLREGFGGVLKISSISLNRFSPSSPCLATLRSASASVFSRSNFFFGEELVGIADNLFFQSLWQKVLMRQRKTLLLDFLQRQAGSRVAFAHPGMSRVSLGAQHLRAQHSVAYVRLGAEALDVGSVRLDDAYVVNHGGLHYELTVKTQAPGAPRRLPTPCRPRPCCASEVFAEVQDCCCSTCELLNYSPLFIIKYPPQPSPREGGLITFYCIRCVRQTNDVCHNRHQYKSTRHIKLPPLGRVGVGIGYQPYELIQSLSM